jgi:hypothetical protein
MTDEHGPAASPVLGYHVPDMILLYYPEIYTSFS